jgi:cation transport ATPase
MTNERLARRSLVLIALLGLVTGGAAYLIGRHEAAHWIWMAATIPVVIALALSIVRDLMAGRMGVDAIALLAMSGALALDQSLAAIVVAIMYAGGTVLEDYAVARAERNLKSLIDRAPRLAHRRNGQAVEDVAIKDVKIGDRLLVRAGEIIPVDGLIT